MKLHNLRNLRGCIEIMNYYKRLIKELSQTVGLLELVSMDLKWKGDGRRDKASKKLKRCF